MESVYVLYHRDKTDKINTKKLNNLNRSPHHPVTRQFYRQVYNNNVFIYGYADLVTKDCLLLEQESNSQTNMSKKLSKRRLAYIGMGMLKKV